MSEKANNENDKIPTMIGRYKILQGLGNGRFGDVYKATDKEEGKEIYAVKVFKKTKEGINEGVPKTAIKEVCLLKELNHINIERLIDVLHLQGRFTLVFEFIPKGLDQLIEREPLSPELTKSYMYQILKGIEYLHKNQIIHRDLKPQNLLITTNDIIKLADFGLARGYCLAIQNLSEEVVTVCYRPPDVLLGNTNYSTEIDIWSIGCIFMEMISGSLLFKVSELEKSVLQKIFYCLGTPNESTYPGVTKLPKWKEYVDRNYPGVDWTKNFVKLDKNGIDLLKKMLQIDPKKRISASEALEHEYFKNIDQKTLDLYKNEL